MILFDIIELVLGGDIMKLTRADKAAIQNGDSNYLVNKGIRYYYDQDYEVALDYFHLAAALGNGRAAGYIGHCYMHGEGVPAEVDLALSYFRIGMDSRDVESFYRLGKNYCDGVGVEKDHELGVYYYENALAVRKMKLGEAHPYTQDTQLSIKIMELLIDLGINEEQLMELIKQKL